MIEQQIRLHLAKYLSGAITFQAFDKWFTGATWNIDKSNESGAKDLANELELLIAEFTNDLIDETEFRHELKAFLRQPELISQGRAVLPPGAELNTRLSAIGVFTTTQGFLTQVFGDWSLILTSSTNPALRPTVVAGPVARAGHVMWCLP